MEAYMPDTLALYKLRGFAQDMSGEILDSKPGLIRMRLDDSAGKSWNPFRKRSIVDLDASTSTASTRCSRICCTSLSS